MEVLATFAREAFAILQTMQLSSVNDGQDKVVLHVSCPCSFRFLLLQLLAATSVPSGLGYRGSLLLIDES